MRVKTKVNVRIYDTTTEKDILFAPADSQADLTTDNLTEESSGRFSLAGSGVFTVPFGTVNAARGVLIRGIGNYDLVVNGAAVPLQIRQFPSAALTTPARFYYDGIVTSVQITNASSTATLEGWYCVFGDAT